MVCDSHNVSKYLFSQLMSVGFRQRPGIGGADSAKATFMVDMGFPPIIDLTNIFAFYFIFVIEIDNHKLAVQRGVFWPEFGKVSLDFWLRPGGDKIAIFCDNWTINGIWKKFLAGWFSEMRNDYSLLIAVWLIRVYFEIYESLGNLEYVFDSLAAGLVHIGISIGCVNLKWNLSVI